MDFADGDYLCPAVEGAGKDHFVVAGTRSCGFEIRTWGI